MSDRFNMGFTMEDIANEAKKMARKMAEDRCREIIGREFYHLFMGPQTTKDGKPGVGYEIIQNKISEMLLSENFQITIENQIGKVFAMYFDKALHEAAERAARKVVFTKTEECASAMLRKGTRLELQSIVNLDSRTNNAHDTIMQKKNYEVSSIETCEDGTNKIILSQIC